MANTINRADPRERRRGSRYPLRLSAECAFRKLRAPRAFPTKRSGLVLNISTGGCCLLLTDTDFIDVGMAAILRIDWPVRLSQETELQLHVWGRVIRTDADEVAIEFHRYQFRIKGKRQMTTRPVRDGSIAGLRPIIFG